MSNINKTNQSIEEKTKYVMEIYNKLENELDGNLFDNRNEEYSKSPDYHFLLNLCYGPWREERQMRVWDKVHKNFKKIGAIHKLTDEDIEKLGYPFRWQQNWIKKMVKYLDGKSFTQLIEEGNWWKLSGLEIRDKLKKITGAYTTKVISTFIRDYFKKDDIFAIDRRVRSMLNKLGLPNNEDLMVSLSKKAGINPAKFEIMLYNHYGKLCDDKKYDNCFLKEYCYCYIIKKECCKL